MLVTHTAREGLQLDHTDRKTGPASSGSTGVGGGFPGKKYLGYALVKNRDGELGDRQRGDSGPGMSKAWRTENRMRHHSSSTHWALPVASHPLGSLP